MLNKSLIRLLLCVLIVASSASLRAQDLPGSFVADSAVSQSAITLVGLASQKYPQLFSNPTTWRRYDGFFYKYFANSGVYIGINGSDLYLLGGEFGNTVSYQGTVADAIVVLGGSSASQASPFKNITTASTLKDLLLYFRKITVAYSTVNSTFNLQSAVALEVTGQEVVNGKSTQKLLVTLSGNNIAAPVIYQMSVDAEGIIVKLVQNGYAFPYPSSNTIGANIVSSMLLALRAAEAPAVRVVLNEELANPAVSQKIKNGTINGLPVKTLTIETAANEPAKFVVEVSDFGAFSIASKMSSTLFGTTTSFDVKDVVLR